MTNSTTWCDHDNESYFCRWCGKDCSTSTRTTSRVFVVQNQFKRGEPKFNLRPAEEFGKLVYLLNHNAQPFNSEEVISALHLGLRNYRPEDKLLLLGNPILIGWTMTIAAHYSAGIITTLQWDREMQKYLVVRGDLKTAENSRLPV